VTLLVFVALFVVGYLLSRPKRRVWWVTLRRGNYWLEKV
jgi:hypothetical protein